jgi:hypothetical protein
MSPQPTLSTSEDGREHHVQIVVNSTPPSPSMIVEQVRQPSDIPSVPLPFTNDAPLRSRTEFYLAGVLPILNSPTDEECPICRNTLPDHVIDDFVQIRACEHQFHTFCILTWLQGTNEAPATNTTCPSCRQELYRADRALASRFDNLHRGLWRPGHRRLNDPDELWRMGEIRRVLVRAQERIVEEAPRDMYRIPEELDDVHLHRRVTESAFERLEGGADHPLEHLDMSGLDEDEDRPRGTELHRTTNRRSGSGRVSHEQPRRSSVDRDGSAISEASEPVRRTMNNEQLMELFQSCVRRSSSPDPRPEATARSSERTVMHAIRDDWHEQVQILPSIRESWETPVPTQDTIAPSALGATATHQPQTSDGEMRGLLEVSRESTPRRSDSEVDRALQQYRADWVRYGQTVLLTRPSTRQPVLIRAPSSDRIIGRFTVRAPAHSRSRPLSSTREENREALRDTLVISAPDQPRSQQSSHNETSEETTSGAGIDMEQTKLIRR